MKKRGQMKLSFGMIFSIILIVAFLAFAVYAIIGFLGLQNSAKIGQFKSGLQDDVNTAWRVTHTLQKVSYDLPSKTNQVCFVDQELYGYNVELRPTESFRNVAPILIEHINISIITRNGASDKCFNVNNGKVSMTIEKNFGEGWVTIK